MEQKIDFKKIINNFLPFALPLLIIFVCIIIGTFSKYYTEWQIENSKNVTSDPGFFEGDCFESGTEIKSAEPVIFFGVRNYDSNNICDISDLNYGIKIMDGTTDVTDTLTISPTFTESTRTLVGAAQSEDIIKISGFPDGIQNKNYKVVLSLNSPYDNYSFDATYQVTHLPDIASDEIIFTKDTAPYMIRKIKTNDFVGTKPYTITWDASEEYPDPTDEVLKDLTAENGTGTINLQPNSCYELRFISELEWVTTAEEFNNIRNNLSGKYILGADIDLSEYENWESIGNETNKFTGTLNGNGFTIRNVNVVYSVDSMGLFGYTNGASIQNLKVKNITVSGHNNVGALIGISQNTSVYRCYTTGTVQGTGNSGGGIVGNACNSTISESASSVDVTMSGLGSGGLVGITDWINMGESTRIINCYSNGNVNGSYNSIGGLVGKNYESCNVATSYSTGHVIGTVDNVGGLIGNVGSGTTTNSYYNSTTSGQSDAGKGTPLTADQARNSSNFVGFDFENVWAMTANGPVLKVFVDEFVTKVSTPEEFNNIRNNLSGNYVLEANIDLSEYENWESIGGENTPFTGALDGNGFTISNVSISNSDSVVGLFRFTDGATIQNLKVKNANISGHDNVGILVGRADNTTIYRCYTSGIVQITNPTAGGLIGLCRLGTISECASSANISGGSDHNYGGLIGCTDYQNTTSNHTTILNCYSKGNVSGTSYIGGLIGRHFGSGSVTTSYSIGQVTGSNNVGGLIGNVGSGTTTNSYYNSTTSGQSDTGKGIPLNATQVQNSSNFVGFDFENVWVMTANGPVLKAFVDELVTKVSTPEEFNSIRNNLSGNYVLEANIDLSGYENWESIGSENTPFTGTLDGNGFTISNASISNSDSVVGLFRFTDGATIQNLKVKNADISGHDNVGILVGWADNTTIYRCYTSGTVQTPSATAGGLIGLCRLGTISECASSANVSGGSERHYGGLIGCTDYQNTTNDHTAVLNCYSKGNVSGTCYIGGLIANNFGSCSVVTSYSMGTVTGSSMVGGLIGNVGSGTTTNSYYNSTTSGQSDTGKGIPLNATQVQNSSNFVGFDFENVWVMTNDGPVLRVFLDELQTS